MRFAFLAFVAVALLLPLVSLGQEKGKNPFRNARVGDYVTYKVTMSLMGKDSEATMKETVTAKNDKEVTFKSVTTPSMGSIGEARPGKIDLTKPYDPIASFLSEHKRAKFDKSAKGEEKVKIGDKTYECHWIAGKATSFNGETRVELDVKIWFSQSVPLAGIVKLEGKSDKYNVRVELTGWGHEK